MDKRKLVVLEINEITWDLIDPFIEEGKLPTLARLKREGTWGTPLSVDLPPQLDPWITWTTFYTGQPQEEHNVYFLQQPPESIKAKRVWERCIEAGLKVGVYGSVCSWPPRPIDGYYVPDTFAPDAQTYPESLTPIQQLNLKYTRSIRLPSDDDGLLFKLGLGRKLLGLGLRVGTMRAIAAQLAGERQKPESRWKRVGLQPLVNFDFFSKLYREQKPDFATFHTNHVAHYMHTYWKAMQPDRFLPIETTRKEIEIYGPAIEHGYRVADQLIAKVLPLLDSNTVLMIASSMGQKPYQSKLQGGKQVCQWRSLPALLNILGVQGSSRAISTMSDEFVIYTPTAEISSDVKRMLDAAYIDSAECKAFYASVMDGAVRVNLVPHEMSKVKRDSKVYFPLSPGNPVKTYEDVIYNTGHLKSGCHDERGMVIFYGAGVDRGVQLPQYTNLNMAPTMMSILGLPVPPEMKAPAMHEVLKGAVHLTGVSN
jgi:predicted AlkP superfamily phosphohydrolase/phosphomutase